MLINAVTPRSLYKLTPLQKIANKIGEHIPNKLSHVFEMNQVGTIDRMPLVLLSFLFVLGARFIKSRDAHERREVLTRDGLTIGTAMLGVPVVKNWMERGLDKITKIPVATEKNKLFSLYDFGFGNLHDWYATAKHKPEKALSVAKDIKARGGDIAVAFSKLGNISKSLIKTMLGEEQYTSENILNALEKASKAANGSKELRAFNALTNMLSKENGLVSAAQRLKSIPALASIVLITTLLGWGIPAFNIHFTRHKLKHHHHHNHNNLEPDISDSQQKIISSFLAKI